MALFVSEHVQRVIDENTFDGIERLKKMYVDRINQKYTTKISAKLAENKNGHRPSSA